MARGPHMPGQNVHFGWLIDSRAHATTMNSPSPCPWGIYASRRRPGNEFSKAAKDTNIILILSTLKRKNCNALEQAIHARVICAVVSSVPVLSKILYFLNQVLFHVL